jgi:hypothetical protein
MLVVDGDADAVNGIIANIRLIESSRITANDTTCNFILSFSIIFIVYLYREFTQLALRTPRYKNEN